LELILSRAETYHVFLKTILFIRSSEQSSRITTSTSEPVISLPRPPKSSTCCKSLSVLYFNCRSVLPKHDELVALCLSNRPDVICLVETWLSTDILDNEVAIPHYSLLRSDRNRHGGGVAIYVHCSILFNVLLSGPPSLELIMVSLTKNSFKLRLCVFYRLPSTCADIFDNLCEALFSVDVSFFCKFLLVGDFNVDFNNPSGHLYPHVSNLMHTFLFPKL